MYKLLTLAIASSMISACSLLPTISPEAHARYVCRGNGTPQINGVYRQCGRDQNGRPSLKTQEEIDREFQQMLQNQSNRHELPLFDSGANGPLTMNRETRMLMDMDTDTGYQGNQSIVIRDGGTFDHEHSNHRHNDNLIHDENELRMLEAKISEMQQRLESSRKHQAEHTEIEAVLAQHKGAW